MTQGKYIVIEGGDGAGKDTQLKLLANWLAKQKVPYIVVREPYDRILGDHMISILKDADPTKSMTALDPWQQAMLYNAARRGILTTEVKPSLEAGKWVLASRNYVSTLAYQGYGGKMDQTEMQQLRQLCALGTAGIEADLTIILDVDPSENHRRQEGKDRDAFERSDLSLHQRIRDGYLQEAKISGYPVINGAGSIEQVATEIQKVIQPLIVS